MFRTFKNPERGPRHPFAAALMCLAAIVDGRIEYALATKIDDITFRFVTGGDYEIEVRYFKTDELGEWVSVQKAITPEGVEVHLNLTHDLFTEAFLPILRNEGGVGAPMDVDGPADGTPSATTDVGQSADSISPGSPSFSGAGSPSLPHERPSHGLGAVAE